MIEVPAGLIIQKQQMQDSAQLPSPMCITRHAWPAGTLPLVSVLCSTYNHEKFIREALEGFLMQRTTFPVEIVVHDDASTDGTTGIVREYVAKYPHLLRHILQPTNLWPHTPRDADKAALFCRGKFIALCEGDDCWISNDKLQKQVTVLNEHSDVALVFHNAWVKHDTSARDKFVNAGLAKSRLTLSEVINRTWFVATASLLIRKECFRPPKELEFCTSQDVVIQLTAALQGDLYYIDEVMSVYRQHSGGISECYRSQDEALYEVLLPNLVWMNWAWYADYCPQSHLAVAAGRVRSLMKMIVAHGARQSSREFGLGRAELFNRLRTTLNSAKPCHVQELAPGKPDELRALMEEAVNEEWSALCFRILDYYGRHGQPIRCLSSIWQSISAVSCPKSRFLKSGAINFVRGMCRALYRRDAVPSTGGKSDLG